jgi:hypothetical protein
MHLCSALLSIPSLADIRQIQDFSDLLWLIYCVAKLVGAGHKVREGFHSTFLDSACCWCLSVSLHLLLPQS